MLVSKRIILRTVLESDIDKLFELSKDVRDVGEHYPMNLLSKPKFKARFAETGFWEQDGGWFLITDLEGELLGFIGFFKVSRRAAFEVGFRIYRPENWGKGYMAEAVSIAVAYLFEVHQIERVEATTTLDNVGSQRVLEKCGFQFEGVLRKTIFRRGDYIDLRLYSILLQETQPLKAYLA